MDDLAAFMAHIPPNLHVVAATRGRWAAARRLRLEKSMSYLTEADLAFTPEEAWLLFHEAAGHELTAAQLQRVMERTGGWPVAVHGAAAAVRDADDVDDAIATFGAADRRLGAFLDEEVLSVLPDRVRSFLTQTSVLVAMDAELCDVVTGHREGAMMLGLLERRGLFVRRTVPGGASLAYTGLVRDLLRHNLRISHPGAEPALLLRAAQWHLDRGEADEAASYLIAAEEWDPLLEVIQRYGRSRFESGKPDEVARWVDAVRASRGRRPVLLISAAFVYTMLGQTRRAEQAVHELDATDISEGDRAVIDALRATWVFFDALPHTIVRVADAALEALDRLGDAELPDVFGMTSPDDLRMMAAGSRARALWSLGDVGGARTAFTQLSRQRDAYAPWRVHVLSALALLEAWAGNLRAGHQHSRHALLVAARAGLEGHPGTIDARLAAAHVAREHGDFLGAASHLAGVMEIANRTRRPVTMSVHAVESALLQLAIGHPDTGLDIIEQDRGRGDPPPPPIVARRLKDVEVRLLVAMGRLDRAEALLSDDEVTGAALGGVHVAVARHDVDTARARLDRWVVDGDQPRMKLERALWSAIIESESGNRRAALKDLPSLVHEAQLEGHVWLFRDAGRPGARLLRGLLHASPSPYLLGLVQLDEGVADPAAGVDVLTLSDRELEVIRYLPTTLSSSEIASQLYISLNTLKTHLRAVYRKLGVSGRSEAIAKAKDLGIA
jgi:LuxR family maltose regulon positive regulatory protein